MIRLSFRSACQRVSAAALAAAGLLAVSVCPSSATAGSAENGLPTGSLVVYRFGYTGSPQSWVVPAGVTEVTLDVQGAEGGGGWPLSSGGLGGRAAATATVSAGTVFQVNVGGRGSDYGFFTGSAAGGANGGGNGSLYGGAGGGATDVRTGSYTIADRLIVAGGGGGGAWGLLAAGGSGGGEAGAAGIGAGHPGASEGGGGTQFAGGSGGASFSFPSEPCGPSANGAPGALGQGGDGGYDAPFCDISGGGGGGGYFGGGGGGASAHSYFGQGGGGGGGSGYINPALTPIEMSRGVRSGNGVVFITYSVPATDDTPPVLDPSVAPDPLYLHETGAVASPNAYDAGSGVASSSCDPVDTSAVGVHTLTCQATDNSGNTSEMTVEYLVEYKVLGFFSPAPGSKWRAAQTVPVKVALSDVDEVRIPDAEALTLVSSPSVCRIAFSASGAQELQPRCMRYEPTDDQFLFTWKLANSLGVEVITASVSYRGTSATTTRSEQIVITS